MGAGRSPLRHRDGSELPQHAGPGLGRLHRRGGDLCAGRGPPGAAQSAHAEPAHPGGLRRDPSRWRRAVLGRGDPGGVRAGQAKAGADRHAFSQRHQPDPVRDLRARRGRQPAQLVRLRLRIRPGPRRRRRPPGDLPGVLRRDALAHQGRGRDRGDTRQSDDGRAACARLADRARSRRASGSCGCSRPPIGG